MASTINTIIWKKNLSDEGVKKFLEYLDNTFEMFIEKIHPSCNPNAIGKFFVIMFDKFVRNFVSSYNKSSTNQKRKDLLFNPMCESFKKLFEVLVFGHRD